MELNLQKLFSAKAESETGNLELDFSARDFGWFAAVGPAAMVFEAKGGNGAAEVAFSLETEISANCARCTEPFSRPWRLQRELRFTPADLLEEDPEFPFTQNGGLNLEELAYGELLLDVDPVLLCREDCPGLCQNCGKPSGACGCREEAQIDPRLQVLKQLLSEEDIKP